MVVVCPSNPVVSIGPILGLPEVRETLSRHPRVVAVSPIVERAALKGPADRLLPLLGVEASAVGVAKVYADLCNTFVLDQRDGSEAAGVESLGMRAVVTDTIMSDEDASTRLASVLLATEGGT
jgi:LPPG:FO 2-phospho-L-lactate transferase